METNRGLFVITLIICSFIFIAYIKYVENTNWTEIYDQRQIQENDKIINHDLISANRDEDENAAIYNDNMERTITNIGSKNKSNPFKNKHIITIKDKTKMRNLTEDVGYPSVQTILNSTHNERYLSDYSNSNINVTNNNFGLNTTNELHNVTDINLNFSLHNNSSSCIKNALYNNSEGQVQGYVKGQTQGQDPSQAQNQSHTGGNIQGHDKENQGQTRENVHGQTRNLTQTVKATTDTSVRICSSSERRSFVSSQRCQRANFSSHKGKLLVNHKRKIAYCFVPKIGSSTLSTLMALAGPNGSRDAVLAAKGRMHHRKVLKSFGLYFIKTTSELVKEYHTVVVMRHPFTRLVSAYTDKMVQPKFKHSVKHFLNATKPPAYTGFNDFVGYIIDGYGNRHWNPVSDMCDMCRVRYDSVMRIETFAHDMGDVNNSVLDVLGLNVSTLNGFSRNRKRSKAKTESVTENRADYTMGSEWLTKFQNVSTQKINALLDIYKDDFIDFGYQYDIESQTATCKIQTDNDICC